MERIKKRDFILHFSQYEGQSTEVLGKNNQIIGTWVPFEIDRITADGLSGKMTVNKGEENSLQSKSELSEQQKQELTDGTGQYIGMERRDLSDKAQKFQELKAKIEEASPGTEVLEVDDDMQKDMDEIGAILKRELANEGFGKSAIELDKEILNENGFVGICDICGNPSQELWEHEEEGVERNVCRNCFAVIGHWETADKFEAFLRTKRKVSPDIGRAVDVPLVIHKVATFTNFNPIPKPLKKEKKK